MRGQTSLTFLLVLLWASNGWTQGTSLTVLMDEFMAYDGMSKNLERVLNSSLSRFPSVTRQFTTVSLDFKETKETITNNKTVFLQSMTRSPMNSSVYDFYYNRLFNCNQSLLYGLKRALEISPAESIIWVYTSGSMVDYNDAQLLSDIYTLLEEKKSQVYFLWYTWWSCIHSASQDVFNQISSSSYGKFLKTLYTDNFKLMNSLEILLSKPLNSSVRILSVNPNVNDTYTTVFDVTTSLSYLLVITGDETSILYCIDPNGNTFTLKKKPYSKYYFRYHPNILTAHLVKSPAAGSWILNAQGNSSLSVQILGITGLDKSGTCSDSDCHPNATCSEFGGYGECTCKEGFAGDGTSCNDIDECQQYYYRDYCSYYYGDASCVNTIGSYNCKCKKGFEYKEDFGCVDIDECADSSLNDCDPVAICTNNNGSYTCTCPYGYYGDGRHCEVNECQQGTPCSSYEDCVKYIGSYSCIDPCSNNTVLNDPWRGTSNRYNSSVKFFSWYHCDFVQTGWYRFKGDYDQQIPERCVPTYSCATYNPTWMNGSHPNVNDGIVNRTACSSQSNGCCARIFDISVKCCPGKYYVYKLQRLPGCISVYCTESNYNCSGRACTPDEDCRKVDGVDGCYCKDSSSTSEGCVRFES